MSTASQIEHPNAEKYSCKEYDLQCEQNHTVLYGPGLVLILKTKLWQSQADSELFEFGSRPTEHPVILETSHALHVDL